MDRFALTILTGIGDSHFSERSAIRGAQRSAGILAPLHRTLSNLERAASLSYYDCAIARLPGTKLFPRCTQGHSIALES